MFPPTSLWSCFLFSLAILPTSVIAQSPLPDKARERILLTTGWHFQKNDPAGVGDSLSYEKIKPWLLPTGNGFRETPAIAPTGTPPGEDVSYVRSDFDDSAWRTLDLPHDWGVESDFDQSLPGATAKLPYFGVGWYRKTFDLPASDQGKKIALEIDGAMSYATVWCNGKFVGGWPYGYASWNVDLTPYVKFGGHNSLSIRVDNPNESSRWYPGGGIYRNVWLTKTSLVHIAQWGTKLTTSLVSEASANVSLKAEVVNDSPSAATVILATKIVAFDQDGKAVGQSISFPSGSVKIPAGSSQSLEVSNIIPSPRLWDTEHPNLYAAITTVTQDGKVVDRYQTLFGIRTAEFTVDDGLHLNGKRVPIHGVCLHHDLGALGTAINVRAMERELQILKEAGVNGIRTSHNPPAPEFLDLCDRMGFVVMSESFDCWKLGKKKNDYNRLFEDWSEADMRSSVRHYRNHPSVVLWSIGNEIGEQGQPDGPAMEKRLTDFTILEDGTRPTIIGCSGNEGGFNGFQKNVGVFGINYFHVNYKDFHEKNPKIPFTSSESSSTMSSRGEYFFGPGSGASDFQVNSDDLFKPGWGTTPDEQFHALVQFPMVAGEFVWTGFDYLGEPTPYDSDMSNLLNYTTPEAKAAAQAQLKALGKIMVPSRSSYFGMVDLAGFRKDRFYLYQSVWRPDLPMAHLSPHWNWPDRLGQVTPVQVYTSGDEAELFLNGKSLGRKKKGPTGYRLRWDDVKYEPGELRVVAYKDGKEWATDVVKTTGEAAKIRLSADRSEIRADGRDLSFVTATVVDKEGNMVPRSHPKLKFSIRGPGEIVSTDNGDATDHVSFKSTDRTAFNGLALAIVCAKAGSADPITLRVEADGLTPAEIMITPKLP